MALAEVTQPFDVHPNQITQWKAQLLKGTAGVIGPEKAGPTSSLVDVKKLQAKIGELTLVKDYLKARSARSECGRAQSDD